MQKVQRKEILFCRELPILRADKLVSYAEDDVPGESSLVLLFLLLYPDEIP